MGDQHEQSLESKALAELISLSEYNFQGKIIEPLLSCLGFENVRDNAGPHEKGKDLVATKRTEFGRTKLYAIQIKKTKLTGRVDSPQSLGSLFLQLLQARDETVLDPTTNTQRSPDACLFITPYPIAPSVSEKFHQLSLQLQRQNIEIIDGRTILDLVRRHLPGVLEDFSMDVRYRYQLELSLNRIPESTIAFSLRRELELSDIYVDAFLEASGSFFEKLAAKPALLQGRKLLALSPAKLKKISDFGNSFGIQIEIVDPPEVYKEKDIKKLKQLEKKTSSPNRVVQVNLDPLIEVIQSNARKTLTQLSEIGTFPEDNHSAIALEFVTVREKVRALEECDFLMDQWISFVSYDKPDEWSKPGTRIPSNILGHIDCNKYIVGAPGAGKTTLLRTLARELSRSKPDVLPVFLPLVLLEGASSGDLIRACIKQLEFQGYLFPDRTKETSAFCQMAKLGELQLFLDGLDEAGSEAATVLKTIVDFAEEFPRLGLSLTCRNTLDMSSFKGALELRLTPFSREQLRQFVNKWFNSQPSSAAALNSWLESNEKITRAASNPLVAALLCSLFHIGAEMPSTEVELYERRFELLFGKWDQAKGIRPLNSDLLKRYWRFICELAFNMHERELRLISGTDATLIAQDYYSGEYHGDSDAMITDCVQRGVLEYESTNGLSLGHLTYQEYLVARKLALENDLKFILRRVGLGWWRNVIRFYVSFKEDISSLIRLAIDSNCSARVVGELIDLCELAPWTNTDLIHELKEAAPIDLKDHDVEYDLLVMRELQRGRTIRDALRTAGHKITGLRYEDERSDEEALAYYDFLLNTNNLDQ